MDRRTALLRVLTASLGTGNLVFGAPHEERYNQRQEADPRVKAELQKLLPDYDDDRLEWLALEYANTAIIEIRDHGKNAADTLYHLGAQGLAIMRTQHDSFREISKYLGGVAAVHLLIFYRNHFEEFAKLGGLPKLLEKVSKLPKSASELGQRCPQMFSFLALSPVKAFEALCDFQDLCLVCLPSIDLSSGPQGLDKACDLLIEYGSRVRPWIEVRGLDGLLLTSIYQKFLGRASSIELPIFLAILSECQEDLTPLMQAGRTELVWLCLEKLAASDERLPRTGDLAKLPMRGSYLQLASIDRWTIRFMRDHGEKGLEVLTDTWSASAASGVTLPSLLYDGYGGDGLAANLLRHAWEALEKAPSKKRFDVFWMLLLMGAYKNEIAGIERNPRRSRFRNLLAGLDHRVVLYLAEAESDPHTVLDKYQFLEQRGLPHLDAWESPPSILIQAIPGYDAAHLAWLLATGCTPTRGEILFAGVDVAFAAWDIATLGAGEAAASSLRTSVKAGSRKATEQALGQVAKGIAPKLVVQMEKGAGKQAVVTLAWRLASSSKVLMEVSSKGLFRDVCVSAGYAARTASALGIRLTATIGGKFVLKQWAFNVAGAKSLEQLVKLIPDDKNNIFAVKIKEVILALGRNLEKPVF